MIKFKEMELEDKDWINLIVRKSGVIGSEYPFAVNYLWKDYFGLESIEKNDFYTGFIKKTDSYLFPIMDKNIDFYNERLREIILDLIQDSKKRKIAFKMHALTKESKVLLEKLFPNQFNFYLNRSLSDYIYRTRDLIDLTGKKYHSKRNCINSFKKIYPNWEYKILTKEVFVDCIDLSYNWYYNQSGNEDTLLRYEVNMLKTALDNFYELNIIGGAVLVDENIIGFSLGTEVNNHVFDNIIEKACVDYRGAYSILIQQFLKNSCYKYEYVNREEDLGKDNLRKSKLMLHPYAIIDKYDVVMI